MSFLDETCFYAESGGQCADTGKIWNDLFHADVTDVKKAPHKQPLHHIENVEGTLHLGDEVEGAYDYEARQKTRANHSCLHLLQAALREVLGSHIAQAGSYNCPDYARFDFTHFEKPTAEQLKKVEEIVNEKIQEDIPVTTEVLPISKQPRQPAQPLCLTRSMAMRSELSPWETSPRNSAAAPMSQIQATSDLSRSFPKNPSVPVSAVSLPDEDEGL